MPKPENLPSLVIIHPLVLLSAVDHYYRVAKDTKKRVVGVLLGTVSKGQVDVTNSYAVPFEEDEKNPHIWFLDHNYHENMWSMFKKVSARERVIGWYSSGPKIKPSDIEIHQLWKRYVSNPVFVIIDVQPKEVGIPTKAYFAVDDVEEEATGSTKALSRPLTLQASAELHKSQSGLKEQTPPAKEEQRIRERFVHVPSIIGAFEVEEVGVEHLLRDVKDSNISTLTTQLHDKVHSLHALLNRLQEMRTYLDNVTQSRLPINHNILNQMQEVFNLLPNIQEMSVVKSFMSKTNDMFLVIYLASLCRSVIALHSLINNKLDLRAAELEEGKEKKEEKEQADENDENKDKTNSNTNNVPPKESSKKSKPADPKKN
jgi:26S proteasome regulatory subunit N8